MQGSSQQGSEHTINATTNVAVVASASESLLSEDREENTRRENRESLDILEDAGDLLFTADAGDAESEDNEKSDKKSVKVGQAGPASSSITSQSVAAGINAADLLSVGGGAGVSAGQAGRNSGNSALSEGAYETSGDASEETSDTTDEDSDTDGSDSAESDQDNKPENQETPSQGADGNSTLSSSALESEISSEIATAEILSDETSSEASVIIPSVPVTSSLSVTNVTDESVEVTNQKPLLQADYVTVNVSQLTVNNDGILTNDTDAEGGLFLKSVNGQSIDMYGTTHITGEYGELRINRQGQWNYQPDTEALSESEPPLTENFVYEASDGEHTVDSIFSMQLNHAPQAVDLDVQILADQPMTSISLQATDRDQGDTLSYSLETSSGQGIVSIASDGEAVFYTTDAFSDVYAGEVQTASFSYQVTDLYGSTDTATVQLSVTGTKQAFTSNLVENSSAIDGLDSWDVLSNGGSGWAVNSHGYGDSSSFITSYQWGRKSQLIDLENQGYDVQWLDSAPQVQVSEWYKGIARSNDYYQFKIELRDENQGVIEQFDTGIQTASSQWQQVAHSFDNYGAGLRYIYVEHGGKDSEYWWGHYGTAIDDTTVVLEAPVFKPSVNGDISTQGISLVNSQILLQSGHTAGLVVGGTIVSDGEFSSVDQWGMEHQGGSFSANMSGTPLSIRLYSIDDQGRTGTELLSVRPQDGSTALNIENLPYGNYLLAVGPEDMEEADATAMLDYPVTGDTGSGEYLLSIQADAALTGFPRDLDNHAAIIEQYESAPVVIMAMTIVRDEGQSDNEGRYHYVLRNGDDTLFEGGSILSEGQTEQTLQMTIDQNQWNEILVDDLSVAVYQLDSNGIRGLPAVFDVMALQTADGSVAITTDTQDGSIAQLWETDFDSFDVLFSESLDDGQDSLYV
ncbi:hypothetical protein CI610_02359 [invertebrate metagenome]|uniref:FBA domain-containing protein n=1 Tax=invertebrate metagenome TaxID=1711999 RepID=A0A2H9T645_9ZZZZ